ncbi:UMP-CMP kinase 2, mitochondrial isoform X1 [Malaclemys terrapin pileata]|uniref:UMP-CMP kinase 2, mitochondrial isoform X1 n=1 Tax=Malaclemys terrapin pileata TaxID=2991368 RepID=UPI0023A8B5A8|nr:UMP-CMP kinase 2, mitochondrial isoform X1 [Malaclemys terrapin pileata]
MLHPSRLARLTLLPRSLSAMAAPPAGCSGQARPCFAVEGPGSDLVCFTLSDSEGASGSGRPEPRCFVPAPGRCYSLCVPAAPSVPAARLHRRLQQRLRQGPFGRCRVLGLLCYGAQAALEKGFLIQDPQGGPETERALEELLRGLGELPPPLGVYEAGELGELWQCLWALRGPGGRELLRRARVVAVEEPPLHPAVPGLRHAAVFHSLEAARSVVEQCTSLIPEATAVLDLVDKCPKHSKKGEFPVIVIEGLDATGKTTVTQSVKDSLNALLLRSPPACISQWRKTFDDEPTLIRRAFYALGNYIVASEIAKASTESPVVVDRYWHSTAAYAIATEISGKVQNLPPTHHEVYQWPEDLLKPDLVLLLTVSPEERIRRLQGRGLEKTEEETELEANSLFRQKVEESYKRMENPGCQEVDASPSREEVLRTVLHLIKKHCGSL